MPLAWQIGSAPQTAGPVGEKLRQLHRFAHSAGYVILLATGPRRHFASRVLGPSSHRLAADMRAAHRGPVLPAETFVDPARFVRHPLLGGELASARPHRRISPSARHRAPLATSWQPKEVRRYKSKPHVRARLSPEQGEPDWQDVPPPNVLRRLFDFLATGPESCKALGERHALATPVATAAEDPGEPVGTDRPRRGDGRQGCPRRIQADI